MFEMFIPIIIILLGVIGLTVYTLVMALKDALRQITRMNEQLLLMAGMKDGNVATGRALLASAKQPIHPLPGIASQKAKSGEKPKDDKPGYKYTIGSR